MTFSNAKGTDINVTDTTMPSCIKCYCFSTFPSLLCSRNMALVQASVSSPHPAPRNDFPGLTLSVRCGHGPGPGHRLILQRTRWLSSARVTGGVQDVETGGSSDCSLGALSANALSQHRPHQTCQLEWASGRGQVPPIPAFLWLGAITASHGHLPLQPLTFQFN